MTTSSTNDDDVKIFNVTEDPAFLKVAKKMQDWNQCGFFSCSALVNKQSSQESFAAARAPRP
ncbi:MAG: hypothetical protein HFF17_05840 [Oscillospiraceae bacterium]|nr:hypothetical protein [Oscillospiraceae bacterium]